MERERWRRERVEREREGLQLLNVSFLYMVFRYV